MPVNNENRSVVTKRDPPTGMDPIGVGIVAVRGEPAERRIGERAGPIPERAFWSEKFCGRVDVEGGSSFEGHGPAYHFGASARDRYPGRNFDDVESEMSSEWVASRGPSILSWEWAKHAARDAWNRISPSTGVCA